MSNRLDSATSQITAIGAPSRTTPTESGSSKDPTSVTVQVLAKLSETSFSVKVNGQSTVLVLPPNTQIGATITLDTKIQQLQQLQQNELQDASSSTKATIQERPPVNIAALSAAQVLSEASTDTTTSGLLSSQIQLSDFSRLIDTLLRTDTTRQTTDIATTAPVFTTPTSMQDTHLIATALQQQIGNTGLFYESHLAEWINGKRELSAIQAEPQANLPSIDEKGLPATNSDAAAFKEIIHLVKQQLHSLENDTVKWQGDLLPGHRVELDIRREHSSKKNAFLPAESDAHWYSVVRFSLPALGTVTARIGLHGKQLNVSLQAQDEHITQFLRSYAGEFSRILATTGTDLTQFSIKTDGNSV
ncbi:flagellar hook-length control protein FliK [Undibacterium sp. MH2W]|uniref:flagellar hook-length control protein FliK n=1 Tax=Undibacterium sp. MH2W TaxID=3413044 RepID=UPI003BF39DA6